MIDDKSNKCQETPKGKSKRDTPKKRVTQGTLYEEKHKIRRTPIIVYANKFKYEGRLFKKTH